MIRNVLNTGKQHRLLSKLTAAVLVALVLAVGGGTAAAQTDINGCTNINSAGSYEVTQDVDKSLTGFCFTVTSDDVVIDGNGNTINATTTDPAGAISVQNVASQVSNVTIENLTITNFETGVTVEDSKEVELVDIGTSSTETSVSVENGTDVTVEGAIVSDTEKGIYANASDNVTVKDSLVTSSELVEIPDDLLPPDPILPPDPTFPVVTTSSSSDNELGIVLENTGGSVVKDTTVSDFNETGIDVVARDTNNGGTVLTSDGSPNEIVGNDVIDNGNGVSILTEESDNGPGLVGVTAASSNDVVDNEITDNEVGISIVSVSPGLQPLSNGDISNRIVENELVDNTNGVLADGSTGDDISNNTVINSTEDGIALDESEDNELKGNFVNDSGRYGIWITGTSTSNDLTDNVAENNAEAGIYVGGVVNPSPSAGDNTLTNNAARGSEYGIWIRNSQDNEVSESLVEDNVEGIAVEQGGLQTWETETEGVSTESITDSGNTFTDDVSRNNDWDFVVETRELSVTAQSSASSFPVTNLSIGASTAPETTLSFDADDVRLRSVDAPESDPDDLENIGRYFEAEQLSGETFLNVSLSYENTDVSGVNEPTLELQQFASTEWVSVAGSSVDTASNTVSANLTGFGTTDFGTFGESEQGGGGGFDLDDYRNRNGVVDTAGLQAAINDFIQNRITTGNLQTVINQFIQDRTP